LITLFLDEYVEDDVATLLELTADFSMDIRHKIEEGVWQTTVDVTRSNIVSIQSSGINIPENMSLHLLERLTRILLPQVTRQLVHANSLPPLFGLDKTTISAKRPDHRRGDVLIEFQLLR